MNSEIQIDKQIRPLVDSMNATGWTETISCCQGHPGGEFFPNAYVAFYCKASRIKDLCRILNRAAGSRYWFDLSIVYSDDVHGSQDDARRGWLALNLSMDASSEASKKRMFKALTELLQEHAGPIGDHMPDKGLRLCL